MIIKNAAATLRSCLETVASLCDEMVVIDTGSTDDSEDVAKSFGAHIVRIPWTRDFSAARNAYLAEAHSDWILSLDADETLAPVDKFQFRRWLAHTRSTAFLFEIRNYFRSDDFPAPLLPSRSRGAAPAGMGCIVSQTIRLFRTRPTVRYCYPVHESLLPAIRRNGGRVSSCCIPIHHFGYLGGARSRETKRLLYRELGFRKIQEYPEHFLGYLEIGMVLLQEGNNEEALRMFRESVRLRPQCKEGQLYLALALLRLGKYAACRASITKVLQSRPQHQDALHLLHLLDQHETN